MKYFYEYLKLIKNGKPISKEVGQALDRIPEYLNRFDYDDTYPNAIIQFIQGTIYLQKGDTGSAPMVLETEQKFWIELMGFVYKENGRQVINDIGLIIGAGSGKSTFMAALALAVMIVGSKKGSDVVVLSNSVKQSQETFRTATEMASDERSLLYILKQKERLVPILGKIKYKPTNSQIEIRAMDNKTMDGTNVRLAIFDEFHSYTVNVIENVRKSSAPKRKLTGFTTFYISTNGQVRNSVFDEYYRRWEKILSGEIEDWGTFPMIYKMDSIEEVTKPELYEKAMPFVKAISDPMIIKRDILDKTIGNPVAQSEVLAKSFNLPQTAFNSLFTTDEIKKALIDSDKEYSNEVAVGYDFSGVDDLTSVAMLWKNGSDMKVETHAWLPEHTFENKTTKAQRLNYIKLIDNGSLTLIRDSRINQDMVFEWVDNYLRENDLQPIGYGGDPWYSKDFHRRVVEEYGEGMIQKIRPNVSTLSNPLKVVKSSIGAGEFYIKDLLLAWSLNNVRVKVDANNNIYPNKEKAIDKIDPVLAVLNAYYVWDNLDAEGGFAW